MQVRQVGIWIGMFAIVAGELSACGGEQASTPATSLPAVTSEAPTTAASLPATAIGRGGNEQDGLATGGAAMGTPADGAAGGGTPAGRATPVNGAAMATPSDGEPAAIKKGDCEAYVAWRDDPEVKAALEKAALWPDVVAEGEEAAAGEPIDKAKMRQDYDAMAKLGKALRASDVGTVNHESLQLAGRAMGLVSRLAGGLADGNLDQQAAGEAVAGAKAAIAAYEANVAKLQAACS